MMDFVRKLVRQTSSIPSSPQQQNSHLGMLTLRRQFRDVSFSTSPLTQAEQQEKLYTVLPLFLKVFKNLPPQDMKEKFGDVLQFTTRVSNLMVTEIRKRASNKSTEQASVDIANFLAAASNEHASRGWILLNCLLLLAAGDQSIIDCMTATHLPSTLVKCLYLFFDLPSSDSDISFTVTNDANEMLQKVFVQTLVRLCGYISPAEELSRKDDLALLFSAVTSWCSPHNKHWRNAASDVLITISRHGLSHSVVQYIRTKHCIKTCINNLWRTTVSVGEDAPSSVLLDVDLTEQLLCVLRFINNTSEVTQLLLDDFRQHQGYIFITEFVLRLEAAATQSDRHLKALLSVIGSVEELTRCGFNELKPDLVLHQSFQTNFVVPVPIGKGESVRNIHAFELLETLFVRCRTTFLARAVLDAVFSVYCRDPANYFILANLNTMSSFSERLAMKDPEIYQQYFAIFEYISLTLGFIPQKELLSISLLLKTDSNIECSIACLHSLQKLLTSNLKTYRDVFREVGLLEMLIKCLQRYSALLKTEDVSVKTDDSNSSDDASKEIKEEHHVFGRLSMDVIVEMIQGSPANADMFRETGGARCAFNTISYPQCRHSALSLVEALILQPVSDRYDDDMATLLGLLSTLSLADIQLKIDILKSLCKVVNKSRLGSIMFRKVGGFVNLVSIIGGMEGYLTLEPPVFWTQHSEDGYLLLEIIFRIITIAIKLSSNEKYFETEVNYSVLLSAIKRLGCFSEVPFVNDEVDSFVRSSASKYFYLQHTLRNQEYPAEDGNDKVSLIMQKILCLFKLLYMAACDLFKDELQAKIEQLQHSVSKTSSFSEDSPHSIHDFPHGHVLHPNMLKLFVKLVPCLSIPDVDYKQIVHVQLYLMEELNMILNNERNEQIMCEAGLLSTLLLSFEGVLIRDEQGLNLICQRTLERLATQSISPQELRQLLRVGKPLHSDNLLVNNGLVALSRVKSLVSLATPRNVGMMNDISSSYKQPPAFVEFDMTMQSCSHLFVPCLFPHSTSLSSTTGTSGSTGERLFPPAHSLAISTWFYVESFCRLQVHPIRLLTLERQVSSTHQKLICLTIMISAKRRRLIVSTFEYSTHNLGNGSVALEDSKETVGFNIEHLCVEGQWHHLNIVLQRSTVLKHSTVSAFFNGKLLGVSKIRYINTYPGGVSPQALNAPISVHGWIGTPTQLSAPSSLVWRIGSFHVFDETSSFIPNSSTLQTKLGPEYVGNYQNVVLPDGSIGSVFAEEHLCFSLLPSAVESGTTSSLQRTKVDYDLISAKRKIGENDGLTSIDFFPNACAHAPGPPRSCGAFSVGRKYKDAPRCFVPKGVGSVLQDVGGVSISLYLVAMARDVEGLYAAVKFLVCVLKSDQRAVMEMERSNGYQALGMLLKEKKALLNSHILHLTFSIAGTVDIGQEVATSVNNLSAFEYLLCDLEIWHNAPQDLHRSLFEHFYELLTESSDTKSTHGIITGFDFIKKCIHFMYSDSTLSYPTISTILKVIQAVFGVSTRKEDILCFGQFAVSLIASSNVSETDIVLDDITQDFAKNERKGKMDEKIVSKRTIHFRNMVLDLVLKCVSASKPDTTFCEVIETYLGFDWILLFMQSHLHHSSVIASLNLLFAVLRCSYNMPFSNPTNLAATAIQTPALPGYSAPLTLVERFRSGEHFGGWLHDTDKMLEKKEASLLGFNIRSIDDFTSERYHQTVLLEAVPVPGFLALQHLMSFHASSQPILKLFLQFLIGQYHSKSSLNEFFTTEIHRYMDSSRSKLDENQKILSLEISQILNTMLRQLLHQDWVNAEKSSPTRCDSFILVNALEYVYQNDISGLTYMFASTEFLTTFIFSLFPPEKVVSFTTSASSKDLEGLLPGANNKLSSHPCVKSVYALLCKILWESVTAQKNKSSQIVDVILEIPTEKLSSSCVYEFTTDIILHIIEYKVDNLEDHVKSAQCSASVIYLLSRMVDKVWKVNFQSSLYRSLYRMILYMLSRKHSTISDQMSLLDALHCLTKNRLVVFDTKFRDPNLIAALCHCLFMVSGDSSGKEFGLDSDHCLTTQPVIEPSKQPIAMSEAPQEVIPGVQTTPQEKGQILLCNAAARVWSEIMTSKKDVLSDTFKMTVVDLKSEQANLDSARMQIREAASKYWANYLTHERKSALGGAKESAQQQKLMKIMSNVVLGSGKKPKKEFVSKLGKNVTIQSESMDTMDMCLDKSHEVSSFLWMARKRSSSVHSDKSSSVSSTPPKESPVKSVVSRIEELKRELALALRSKDVFILEEGEGFTLLQDSHLWTLNHISVVQSLVRLQYNEHEQEENHLKRFTLKKWNRSASELTRERGVWGPEEEETLTKWTLDYTEGPCRMRKRMMKDETFYIRYPHRARTENTLTKHKKPTSKDSYEYYKRSACLSPYYNPNTEIKSEANSPQHSSSSNIKSPDVESSSDELDQDEPVILNLCLKCQPSQPENDMKVNTLRGKEAVSCDICGLSLDQDTSQDEEEDDQGQDGKAESSAKPLSAPRSDGKAAESNDTSKKQPNGLVTSDSVASLSDPSLLEKEKHDNQTLLKLLEKGDKIRNMFRVARIQGLDVHEGLLLFGKDHYYIIDGFTMLKSKEIRDISSLPGEHEPIVPSSSRHSQENLKNENSFSDRMCDKFSYSDIREVHKRRYLLQNISLEVFNKDGRNCLLVFPQNTRTKVYNKFLSHATTLAGGGKNSITGQRSDVSVEQQGPTLLTNLIGEKTVTSRWERGEISNFQYLMHLNTLAGRSYNDLMQYPIFPWIIADYDSETLDLTKPETFRDLSKPMGSQTPSRLEQYKKRYRDWEELGGIETPPYHYGTHYSSAMIVASYLVRMEPFTQHFLRLQGGHFDLADRMFHSIKDSWISASQKNMADVKELIPEFFYLPEFLLNTNRFDLGQKQNGVHLDDVILPTWAKGSTHEFIRAHREALECDYVSSHLHEWIDLIFGYKQKGEAALEANNVFHHLFYEGEVDIYSIKDPLKRNATIGFINNFGQIPKQLFKRPHPQKKCNSTPSAGPANNKIFYKHVETLSSSNLVKEISGPVGLIAVHDRGITATERGKLLVPPTNTRYVSWGHKDRTVRAGLHDSDKAVQIFENLGCDEITCAAMETEDLVVTGNKSTVVHVWRLPSAKDKHKSLELVKCLYGHTMPVTSVAVSASYGVIVSGSEDGSCVLWDLNHLVFIRQLQHHHESPISNISINDNTGMIVTSSVTTLYQWSINGQLIACASALSSNIRNQQITALTMSKLNDWDPEAVVISGHSDGHLRFWRLEYVQVPETAELVDLQVYADTNTKKHATHLLNTCKTPDTLSLVSVGDVAELPWSDISKLELINREATDGAEATNQKATETNEQTVKSADTINLKWKQQLVLKGKIELPRYHGKSRKSYVPPVTCIATSKNHETLYVGDEEGRIFSWTCS